MKKMLLLALVVMGCKTEAPETLIFQEQSFLISNEKYESVTVTETNNRSRFEAYREVCSDEFVLRDSVTEENIRSLLHNRGSYSKKQIDNMMNALLTDGDLVVDFPSDSYDQQLPNSNRIFYYFEKM
ncbi:MAG: hypothetical protein LBR16_05020 [Treponema sp.]|jgi:hypothetical protein|nr:hypothetical protein [Treponema sp.]